MTNFYEDLIRKYADRRDKLKQTSYRYGTVRLVVFVAAVVTLYLLRAESSAILGSVAAAYIIAFIMLVIRHNKISEQLNYVNEALKLNTDELSALKYDFSAFDGATEMTDIQHPFAADLDIFGQQSVFQSINRTVFGKRRLADMFLNPLTEKADICETQSAVRELSQKTDFRQHFCITERVAKPTDSLNMASAFNGSASRINHLRFWHIMSVIVPLLWLAGVIAYIANWAPVSIFGWIFTFALIATTIPQKRINTLYKSFDKTDKILQTFSNLLQTLENEPFESEYANRIKACIKADGRGESASQAIKRLSVIVGALDQRFSLGGLVFNFLFFRDIREAIKLVRWSSANGNRIGEWLDALAEIDALISLGNFAFNHPDYVYPSISDDYFTFDGSELGHPLLAADKCVKNDLKLIGAPDFVVITGANMAGKSTYLRTAGVNFLLACIGAPVCAKMLTVSPANLFTSLRTADSLTTGESYFFAELKRLRMLIDHLQAGEKMFIILDEILKGTNSADKQRGSLALMRQLTALKTCGMLATHDLTLGELENEFPQTIRNFCFEVDISGDMLAFTYQIRPGIARNMNASLLMKKIGICNT
ncbi:MAG: DNA mismatch repair protein MutS [Tannerella sp.]|jgi:hypothetical protein|nr:DNA mismatch repair protein MutS [Tannerella sp.]